MLTDSDKDQGLLIQNRIGELLEQVNALEKKFTPAENRHPDLLSLEAAYEALDTAYTKIGNVCG